MSWDFFPIPGTELRTLCFPGRNWPYTSLRLQDLMFVLLVLVLIVSNSFLLCHLSPWKWIVCSVPFYLEIYFLHEFKNNSLGSQRIFGLGVLNTTRITDFRRKHQHSFCCRSDNFFTLGGIVILLLCSF